MQAILVTGATGHQGGAVARHLLAAGSKVRILVRNPQSPAALALTRLGAEPIPGDFSQPDSLSRAMAGMNGVFSVQPFVSGKANVEVEAGKRLADAAAAHGVSHFVYSSALGAGLAPGVPHFASKAAIESHIKSLRLPYTILQPAAFMENLLMPVVLKGIVKGKLTSPVAIDTPQLWIAVEDIGAMAAKAFASPADYLNRTIPLVGDVASTRAQAATLSRVLGRSIEPGKLPALLVRLFLGADLYRMFRWVDASASTLPFPVIPNLLTFEQWCAQQNFPL